MVKARVLPFLVAVFFSLFLLLPSQTRAATVFNLEGGISLILPNDWAEIECPKKNTDSIFCAEFSDKTTRIEIAKVEDGKFVGPLQAHWLFTDNARKPGFSLVIKPMYWKLRNDAEVVAWIYEVIIAGKKETNVVFCKNRICVRIERGQHNFEKWLPLITQGIFLP